MLTGAKRPLAGIVKSFSDPVISESYRELAGPTPDRAITPTPSQLDGKASPDCSM